ncbi:MAG: MBL fold metallo-hydrolase [Leptolyngbyaceae bacterium]|nr:MBL fold metallo-hydrolase [Leptolyngbyaceae bacterium]
MSSPQSANPFPLFLYMTMMLRRFLLGLFAIAILSSISLGSIHRSMSAPPPPESMEVGLPSNAIGPTIPAEKGYLVEEIQDDLYWVTDGLYNAMFLVYDTGVVVVDAPPTIGENYLKAVQEVTDKPITHLIYSHSHTDHIGAAYLFPDNVEIIAQEETAQILARRQDSRRPLPTTTFRETYTLTLGDQILELAYHGNIHQTGNIFIYAPRQKVLMLIDVVYPGWVPYKNLGIAEDVQSYIEGHDVALSYDFETFLGGHVTRLGTRQDVLESRDYANDLKQFAIEAYQTISIGAIAQQIENPNPFNIYDAYQDALSQYCTDRVLAKWQSRLGAAATYTPDNCWTLVEALGVDLAPDP